VSLGERVRQCRLALGWSQAELARRLNVKQQSIDQLEAGKVSTPRYVIELADALSVPLEWLRHGKGRLRFGQTISARGRSPTTWTFEAENAGTGAPRLATRGGSFELNGQWFCLVPIFDARTSAGPDALATDDPKAVAHSVFRQEWLGTLTPAAPGELAMLRVAGDSMADTLHEGDHVMLDRSVRRCSRDGLYAIRFAAADEIVVRRLTRDPASNRIMVKSDNAAYGAPLALSDEAIIVEGRVVWLGRTLG
jgi:phage repressor protein C with HTH and peptisase S24 domain